MLRNAAIFHDDCRMIAKEVQAVQQDDFETLREPSAISVRQLTLYQTHISRVYPCWNYKRPTRPDARSGNVILHWPGGDEFELHRDGNQDLVFRRCNIRLI